MQKLLLPILFIAFLGNLASQTLAKKYLLIEHFTNSRCSVCASRNPAFYTTIANYPKDIHHLSIHPPIPYSNCVLYQHNTTDNKARQDFYDVVGTPTIFLNGQENTDAGPLITAAKIQPYLNQTSPLYLKVGLTGLAGQFSVSVDGYSLGQIPAGNYRLFVVLAEKKLDYASPNGEKVHHDVLRDILTAPTGQVFTPAPVGDKNWVSFNFTMNAAWKQEEIYALAFVQNMDTKDVLNSGTNLDPAAVKAIEPIDNQKIRLSPNPADDLLRLTSDETEIESFEFFDAAGRVVLRQQGLRSQQVEISVAGLPSGIYFSKIFTAAGVFSAKFFVR